jgi:hypothetical protein
VVRTAALLPASGFWALRLAEALLAPSDCPDTPSSASTTSAADAEDVEALDPAIPLEARDTALAPEVEVAAPPRGLVASSVAAGVSDALATPARVLRAPSAGDVVRPPVLVAARGFWALKLAEALLAPSDCPDTPSSASTMSAAEAKEIPALAAAMLLDARVVALDAPAALTEALRESATDDAPCALEVASLKAKRGLAPRAVP